MSAAPPLRRPSRAGRIFLFAPAAFLFLLLVASAGAWAWSRQRLVSEMDARTRDLQAAGWTATWADRTISGFPFRLKVVLTDVRLRAPGEGGWGATTPNLEGQAYIVFPTHWVFVARRGLTVLRPLGGPLRVTGDALRASVAGTGTDPPRIALEGVNLAFSPGPQARPFSFTTLKHAEAHLRPSPNVAGDADWLVSLDGGVAPPQSLLWKLVPGGGVDIAASGRLTKLAAATGATWSQAAGAWAGAGGAVAIDRLTGVGGPLHVDGSGGRLGLDAQGRLEGSLPLSVAESSEAPPQVAPPGSPEAAAADAARQGSAVKLPVVFAGGRMRFGPADVGPAPTLR